jgi:hypothetical protein
LRRQRKVPKRKATRWSGSPALRSGATCGARQKRGLARTRLRLRQSPVLIRLDLRSSAHTEGWGKPMRGQNPESLKRAALQGRESQQTVMCAPERSTRGQMKSPSLAQRGEGGVRGGSGEFSPAVCGTPACCGMPVSVGRGLPGGNSLSFASPKESKQRKGDPMVWVPCAALRGNLRCSTKAGSRSNSPSAQTIAIPDPLLPALLGPARRVGEKKGRRQISIQNSNPECMKRYALHARDSQQTVMFARECSARGQMKSPSIAQRGEGGARGGSGELDLPQQAHRRRRVMQTLSIS